MRIKKSQINTTFGGFSRIFIAKRRKNEIKRIRRGHYSCNNFQDSTKEKLLKENMGYLPRVLFFNAFELGTVILKDAHVSARKELEAKESIKKQI
jgi:hypothetical protein